MNSVRVPLDYGRMPVTKGVGAMEEREVILRLIDAVELMMMAEKHMSRVDYVLETYQKYRKRNPMIAGSNTKLADQENITRFDGYADEAYVIYTSLPSGRSTDDLLWEGLTVIFSDCYVREDQALARRLAIYDSSLNEELKRQRQVKIATIGSGSSGNVAFLEHLTALMEQSAELHMRKKTCQNKIKANYQTVNVYRRKILWRKNAMKTVECAQNYIEHQEKELLEIEKQLDANALDKEREVERLGLGAVV